MRNDAEIVMQVLGGNTSGFAALVERYVPMVRALCASHVYDASAHDDIRK